MAKRIFDFLAAFWALFILWPVLLMAAVLILLQSPGPVFYRGIRSGKDGIPFRIFKFRTMVVEAEKMGGPSTALNDPRLTPIGSFLRKYKIDELPQLLNVLKGEMSIVGPRPQVEKYTRLYTDEELIILSVRPGLSDYASIEFINLDQLLGNDNVDERYLNEIEPRKNKLRMKYVNETSFSVDIKIIFRTLMQMFKIKTLWKRDD